MNRKIPFNIVSLLLIYALLVLPLLYTQSITAANSAILLLSLSSFYLLGGVALSPIDISNNLLPISHAALSVFIGALLYSLLLFVIPSATVLVAVLLIAAVVTFFLLKGRVTITAGAGLPTIIAYVLALLIMVLISTGDFTKQFTAQQIATKCYTTDSYFFTSIVASIRNGSIFSASYEVGSPINYQLLGFFIPALIAKLLSITSHQALWGLTLPLYKLLAILLWYEVFFFFLREKIARTNYLFLFLAIVFPVLLAPLHPMYVLKGVVKNFVFNGFGYLTPSGTITYPISIILLLFCLLLFAKIDWKNRKITADKLYFTVGLSVLLIAKIPIYVSFMLFLGPILLKRVLFDKEHIFNYLGYFMGSLILSAIVFKLTMGQEAGGRNYFKFGYITQLFGDLYNRNYDGFKNNLIIYGLILFTYLVWMGIRIVGLVALIKSKLPLLSEFFIGAVISLIGTTTMASFIRMELVGSKGNLLLDGTFNVDQFIRSSFYIITIVGSLGILYLLFSGSWKPTLTKGAFIAVGIWCTLAGVCLIYTCKLLMPADCKEIVWYKENTVELAHGKYNDGLIIINPGLNYYGIMMAASDLGRYWSAMDRQEGNLNSTNRNEYRWHLYKRILEQPTEADLSQIKSEGVKYIISTPEDSSQLRALSVAFPQRIAKSDEAKWIYLVK